MTVKVPFDLEMGYGISEDDLTPVCPSPPSAGDTPDPKEDPHCQANPSCPWASDKFGDK